MKTRFKKVVSLLLAMALMLTAIPAVASDKTAYEVQMTQTANGNQAVVTISATGNLRVFDIGVVYEGAIITTSGIEWAPEFAEGYLGEGGTAVRNVTEKGSDYAVVVGAMMDCSYEGPICTMTFTVTDEQAKFQVVKDTANVLNVEEMTPVTEWKEFEGVEISPEAYKVEFWADGEVVSVQYVEDGKAAIAPKNPTRPSDATHFYTFKGWDQRFDYVTEDMVIKAIFEANKKPEEAAYTVSIVQSVEDEEVTLTIVGNGDMTTFDIGIVFEGASIETKNIKWDSYFSECYRDEGGIVIRNVTNKNGNYALVTGAKTAGYVDGNVCAMKFTVNDLGARYKVVLNTADYLDVNDMPTVIGWTEFFVPSKVEFCVDGVVIDTQFVEYGKAAVAPPNPFKEEDERNIYIFKGWDQTFDEVKGAMVVNAVFEVIPKYLVEFVVEGTVVDTQWVKAGEAAVAPTDPVKEETEFFKYEFKGWDQTFESVNEDLVITAVFEEIRKFELGKVNDDDAINAGDALMVLQNAANLAELTEAQFLAGDINQDGKVNAEDALLILQLAAGIIDKFPEPAK